MYSATEMGNHDYLVDNVNIKSSVDSDHEVRCTVKCSYQQDESTENCSFNQCDARGDGGIYAYNNKCGRQYNGEFNLMLL